MGRRKILIICILIVIAGGFAIWSHFAHPARPDMEAQHSQPRSRYYREEE